MELRFIRFLRGICDNQPANLLGLSAFDKIIKKVLMIPSKAAQPNKMRVS